MKKTLYDVVWLFWNKDFVYKHFNFFTGIKSVLVGLLAQKAEVKFDKKRITPEEIIYYVKGLGYGCELLDQGGQGEGTVDINVSVLWLYLQALCQSE